MRRTLICIFILVVNAASAQHVLSGTVTSASDGKPLPFATVALKKSLIGIVTNEAGEFELRYADAMAGDSVAFTYIGFYTQARAIDAVSSPLRISLKPAGIQLAEVTVRPHKPEDYIRMALQQTRENYPRSPFQVQAYYKEKVMENNRFVKCDEGIFRTYCPDFLDTVKNQTQLLLFRQEEHPAEVAFMKKEREKAEAKDEKRKSRSSSTTATDTSVKKDHVTIDLAGMFGGPGAVLSQVNPLRSDENYLDSNQFRHYRFAFEPSTTYEDRETMVISFRTRGKVDHVRESGRIYLDAQTLAFVKLESAGDVVIPFYIRPLLFALGVGVENPTFSKHTEFRSIGGKWYPLNAQTLVQLRLKNKHWFEPDEISDFDIESHLAVNSTSITNAHSIAPERRFNPKKELKTQAYNDENLSWAGLNIIKK